MKSLLSYRITTIMSARNIIQPREYTQEVQVEVTTKLQKAHEINEVTTKLQKAHEINEVTTKLQKAREINEVTTKLQKAREIN